MASASPKIPIDEAALAAFCQKWKITKLELFGSVLRDDFRPDSDVDVLVTFAPDAPRTLWALLDAEAELRVLFGRDVDLVEKTAVEQSRNYIRRKHILANAKVVYAAR